MKVDHSRAALDAANRLKTESTRGAAGARRAARPKRQGGESDQGQVSWAATLIDPARAAAQQASDVRFDLVERAKQLLERGELGRDSTHLADAMIDQALTRD